MEKTEKLLVEMYPEAFEEVKANPIYKLWSGLSFERKEEVLKGITNNQNAKR